MSVILRPLLGDQLSLSLASIRDAAPDDVFVLAEIVEETQYVRHHPQKIALIFAAMRHFAEQLRAQGRHVFYYAFSEDPPQSLTAALKRACAQTDVHAIVMTEPAEFRLKEEVSQWTHEVPLTVLEDDRFLCPHETFAEWAAGRKQLRMEFFYREMRRKTGLLMDGDQPLGGQWNFDAENRKPPRDGLAVPRPPQFEPTEILKTVLELVEDNFGDHFGTLDAFNWPVTQEQAETLLDFFIQHKLPQFGDYQDAMVIGEDFMFHSQLAAAINIGLLDPLYVCQRAEAQYHKGQAPLNAVEGFIRQIIGWREFIRGIYWRFMPDYAGHNFLNAQRPATPISIVWHKPLPPRVITLMPIIFSV